MSTAAAVPVMDVPWETFYYFRNALSGDRLDAYHMIDRGLSAWSPRFEVPGGIRFDEICRIYKSVIRDSPFRFFHVANISFSYGDTRSYITPHYSLTPEEREKLAPQILQFLRRAQRKTARLNDYEKVRALHDSMVKHILYEDQDHPNEHNIVGPILHRKSVCEGIAVAFKLLCDLCEVPCIVVSGTTDTDEDWQTLDRTTHAWNMVQLDGAWFHIDITFDTTISSYAERGFVKHPYFLRSDKAISVDHRTMTQPRPRSGKDFSIYRADGLYARTTAEAAAFIRMLKGQSRSVIFEYDPNIKNAETFFTEAMEQARLPFSYRYSIDQKYRIFATYSKKSQAAQPRLSAESTAQ